MTTLRRQLGLAAVMAVVMGDILVPLQLMNVATVAAVFRLRKRALENSHNDQYMTPGYPSCRSFFSSS